MIVHHLMIYLFMSLEGTIDLKVNGTSNLIKATEYFSLPAKIPYAIEAKEKTKILLTVIK